MKIAALISQAILGVLTFVAFVKLPAGSYAFAWVPAVVLLCAVLTIVALVRPFGRVGRLTIITLNSAFALLALLALVGLVFLNLTSRSLPIGPGVLALLLYSLPYSFSIVALWSRPVGEQHASVDHAA